MTYGGMIVTAVIVGVCVLAIIGRIVWEVRTGQPSSKGEALGGWFGGAGEEATLRKQK